MSLLCDVCLCYTKFKGVLYFCFSCNFTYHKQPCASSWFSLQIAQTYSQNSRLRYGSHCGQAAFGFHKNSALTESNRKMLRCLQLRGNVAFTNFKTGDTATWSVALQLRIQQEPGSIFVSQSSHADWGASVFYLILTQTVMYAGYFKYATTLPHFFFSFTIAGFIKLFVSAWKYFGKSGFHFDSSPRVVQLWYLV